MVGKTENEKVVLIDCLENNEDTQLYIRVVRGKENLEMAEKLRKSLKSEEETEEEDFDEDEDLEDDEDEDLDDEEPVPEPKKKRKKKKK